MSSIHVTKLNTDLSSLVKINLHEKNKPVADREDNQQMINALWRASKFPAFMKIYQKGGLDRLEKMPSFKAMTKEDEEAFLKYFKIHREEYSNEE